MHIIRKAIYIQGISGKIVDFLRPESFTHWFLHYTQLRIYGKRNLLNGFEREGKRIEKGSQLEFMFTLGPGVLVVGFPHRKTESRGSCLQGFHPKGEEQRDPL